MKKIRTAVVGLGTFGKVHVKTYHEYDKSELVWVCDLDESRAKAAAEQFGCKYTLDSQEIADDPTVDVVSIATPDFAHMKPAMQMINAGKHVLIEKPLTTKVDEGEELIKAAKSKGIKLMTDFQNRWNPPFVEAKQAIKRGEIGSPVMISARLANVSKVALEFLSWSGKSGPEWFLFPHIIDVVRWLIEEEPRKVFAVGQKKILKAKGVNAYDAIQAEVIFDNAFAVFETAWIMPQTMPNRIEFKVDILGSQGKIDMLPAYNSIEIAGESGNVIPFISGSQDAFGITAGFFQLPIKHFVDAVYYDRDCIVKPEDGLVVTEIIDAILRSIESGEPVMV